MFVFTDKVNSFKFTEQAAPRLRARVTQKCLYCSCDVSDNNVQVYSHICGEIRSFIWCLCCNIVWISSYSPVSFIAFRHEIQHIFFAKECRVKKCLSTPSFTKFWFSFLHLFRTEQCIVSADGWITLRSYTCMTHICHKIKYKHLQWMLCVIFIRRHLITHKKYPFRYAEITIEKFYFLKIIYVGI